MFQRSVTKMKNVQGNVVFNGDKIVCNGETIMVENGNVTIGDKTVHQCKYPTLKIEVNGSVESLETMSGDVFVKGDIRVVETMSGDVTAREIYTAKTMSGDITGTSK